MIPVVGLWLAVALSPGATAVSTSCPGTLVLRLALRAGGSFSIRLTEITDGTLELRGENNELTGWLIGVYRADDKESKENLLPQERLGSGPKRGSRIRIEAIDYRELKTPLRLPIGSTGWDLSICLVGASVAGHGGASSWFQRGSVDFRVLESEQKAAGR